MTQTDDTETITPQVTLFPFGTQTQPGGIKNPAPTPTVTPAAQIYFFIDELRA